MAVRRVRWRRFWACANPTSLRLFADAIGIDISRVSIKGKTNEGVDAIGRGEAIAAHAIALVRSASHPEPRIVSPE